MPERRRNTLLRVVEVGYEPVDSLAQWLASITTAIADFVAGRALGVVGRLLLSDERRLLCPYVIRDAPPDLADALRAQEALDTLRVDILAGGPGLRHMTRDAANRDERFERMRSRFSALGVAEMSHVTVVERGHVCSVGILHPSAAGTMGAARLWGQVAVHLRAALRLHLRHRDILRALPDDAAVLDPRGLVLHASGRARGRGSREALRHAVRRIASRGAGGPSKADLNLALQVWHGLVEGTWSIVDRHDHEGRRFIVAVPNELQLRSPSRLTRMEAQVTALATEGYSDKWIGYALGLSRSTVATHLQGALRKLDVPSRVTLSRVFRRSLPSEVS